MSIKLMNVVFSLTMKPAAKLTLLALADNANDEGTCYPSQATLAVKSSQSERTVQRIVKRLIREGHLSVVKRRQRQSTVYRVHPLTRQSDASEIGGSNSQSVDKNKKSVDNGHPDATSDAVLTRQNAGLDATQLCRPNLHSEPSKKTSEGRGGLVKVGTEEPEAIRLARALHCMRQVPGIGIGDLSRMFRVSVEALQAAIREQEVQR
jgi:hypothetical protein